MNAKEKVKKAGNQLRANSKKIVTFVIGAAVGAGVMVTLGRNTKIYKLGSELMQYDNGIYDRVMKMSTNAVSSFTLLPVDNAAPINEGFRDAIDAYAKDYPDDALSTGAIVFMNKPLK